jgi:glycosyltransferase involved in cell wall biosynthesis
VIVGEGPHAGFEAFLTGLAADLRVRLRMITAAGDEDLADLYREADVTVCAAELEPFGLTALESIACGTPVVAVREGGFRESVDDGVTGLLVQPDDAGLAEGIRAVIDGVGRFAPDTLHADIVAAGWTWDACVERLEHHFWAALAGG